jgi:hypothetical protein
VDDFDIFRYPTCSYTSPNGVVVFEYPFNLADIVDITAPLGIAWHDISKKGHDFAFITEYGGFLWDLPNKSVSVSEAKRGKYLRKVERFISLAGGKVRQRDVASIHGTLHRPMFAVSWTRSLSLEPPCAVAAS